MDLCFSLFLDNCNGFPCLHGSDCTQTGNGINDFMCYCIAGWYGTFCENEIPVGKCMSPAFPLPLAKQSDISGYDITLFVRLNEFFILIILNLYMLM